MDWRLWIGFAVASAIMGMIPGPGVASIIGYAVSSGRKTAFASVAGMAFGNAVAMTLSLAGVGALLAASAVAFSIIKWVGAVYLIVLGVVSIMKSRHLANGTSISAAPISPCVAFASNIAVGIFHPKTIVFYVAFVPQFMTPQGDYALQATILTATFCLVVAGTDALYAIAASHASRLLTTPGAGVWLKRAGGGALVASGIATAAARN